MDLPPSSPLLPSSSPSGFTASDFSDDPEHKQQSKEGGSHRLHSPSRGWTPYRRPGAMLAHALERRFTEKTLRPGGDRLSLDDVKKGQPLLSAGLKRLSDKALDQAILMKHASRETRRFRCWASAWELQGARHHINYLTCEQQVNKHDVSGDIAILNDLIQFRHESYNEDLLALACADAQLDTLEAEVDIRISSRASGPPASGSASPNHGDLEEDSIPVSPAGDLLPVASDDEDDAI